MELRSPSGAKVGAIEPDTDLRLCVTGLTFGSISALFGLTNHIIDQTQYPILLTAVIGSAVVPTLIAQVWFQPHFEPLEEDA